jgi:hypothetical protein
MRIWKGTKIWANRKPISGKESDKQWGNQLDLERDGEEGVRGFG